MTLLDWIVFGIIKTHAQAEKAAHDVIDLWHADRIPGNLEDVLGLSRREYQAWTTGGVSLLTIANWKQAAPPALDASKPWFKISGKPGHERVGYLEQVSAHRRVGRVPNAVRTRNGKRIIRTRPVAKQPEHR